MATRISISKIADAVLENIERTELEKKANLSYTSNKLETNLGQGLVKIAEAVREAAQDNQISYADLNEFRKRYDV